MKTIGHSKLEENGLSRNDVALCVIHCFDHQHCMTSNIMTDSHHCVKWGGIVASKALLQSTAG